MNRTRARFLAAAVAVVLLIVSLVVFARDAGPTGSATSPAGPVEPSPSGASPLPDDAVDMPDAELQEALETELAGVPTADPEDLELVEDLDAEAEELARDSVDESFEAQLQESG